jgi:xanthine dehydrogenase YagS FAD-binding subunit
VERPSSLIDISRIPLKNVEAVAGGGARIGSLVRNTDLAYHPLIEQKYPVLASAIMAGASQQLRNMATTGGNILQRTRCHYFYDTEAACNKRTPGSGCAAIDGNNRMHAIVGGSESCIAVNPSDMCVALAMLGARIHVTGPSGQRTISIGDFHRLPGDTPQRDTTLNPGELITAVELPPQGFPEHYTYLKIRDRSSYAFALVSVAVGMELQGDVIREARFALGGIAPKPWRDARAEAALRGKPATASTFSEMAKSFLGDAKGYKYNTFKIDLARRAVARALTQAALATPQSQASKAIL